MLDAGLTPPQQSLVLISLATLGLECWSPVGFLDDAFSYNSQFPQLKRLIDGDMWFRQVWI